MKSLDNSSQNPRCPIHFQAIDKEAKSDTYFYLLISGSIEHSHAYINRSLE